MEKAKTKVRLWMGTTTIVEKEPLEEMFFQAVEEKCPDAENRR